MSSPDTATQILASRNAGISMISTGMMANQWLPIIRAIMTSVAFCLVPFLALFLPTPAFSKAIGATTGFFLLLLIWGVIDAILHQFALDYASVAYEEVKRYGLGVTAIANFSTTSMKVLAAFGTIRWSGLMLATALTGMLVKFGGHAMTNLARGVTSPAQSAGSQAGKQILTPEGRSQSLNQLTSANASMDNASKLDFNTLSDAKAYEGASSVMTARNNIDSYGGGEKYAAAEREARSKSYGLGKGIGASEAGMSNDTAINQGRVKENQDIGRVAQAEISSDSLANTLRGSKGDHDSNIQYLSAFKEGGQSLSTEQAANLKSATGMNAREGMKLDFQVDKDGAINNLKGTKTLSKDDPPLETANSRHEGGYLMKGGGIVSAYAGGREEFVGNFSDIKGHGKHENHSGRISMQDGRVVNAQGDAGYNMSFKQNTTSDYKDLHSVQTGSRSETGSSSTQMNIDKDVGAFQVRTPEGKDQWVTGERQFGMVQGADGQQHRQLVSASFRNGQDGNTVQFERQSDGTMTHSQVQGKYDTKGNMVAGESNSMVKAQFAGKGGYSVTQWKDSAGGVHNEVAVRGQDVSDIHRKSEDRSKSQTKNIESGLWGAGDDLKEENTTGQALALTGGNTLNQGAKLVGSIRSIFGGKAMQSGGKAAGDKFMKTPDIDPSRAGSTPYPHSLWPPKPSAPSPLP